MSDTKQWKALNQPYTTPDPNAYTNYLKEIYSSLRRPLFSTKPHEWEELARRKLPTANFGYVAGSASSAQTYHNNRSAFNSYRLRPKMLVNATRRDTSIELFGRKYPSPLLLAPVGVQEIMHQDGEEATARAASALKLPMIVSTAATRSLEQIAQASNGGELWYQLYWPKPQSEEVTASLLHRAKTNGYKVLVVTLDTFIIGWRPTDLDETYLPFIYGQGCQVGFSDPAFNRIYSEMSDERSASEKVGEAFTTIMKPGTLSGAAKVATNASVIKKARAWMDVMNSGTYREWEHLEILKKLWDGPIVLKGIQRVEDAQLAIKHGMDGIIVSNHGGRQLDGAIGSLDALADITADETVKNSGLTVLFDSGIRTGSDVVKAMALGAKGVLIGRPFMYGLAIDGERGCSHVLKCLLADTDNTLANLGKQNLQQLSREDLQFHPTPRL